MLQWKLLLILAVLSSTTVLGCSGPLATWGAPEVYIPQGSVAEIRGPQILPVWVHGKDGKITKGYVRAYDRYLIGPATPSPVPSPLKNSEVR